MHGLWRVSGGIAFRLGEQFALRGEFTRVVYMIRGSAGGGVSRQRLMPAHCVCQSGSSARRVVLAGAVGVHLLLGLGQCRDLIYVLDKTGAVSRLQGPLFIRINIRIPTHTVQFLSLHA